MAAEVQAALDGFHRDIAIVCPAIPDLGRTVSEGQVRGRGAEAGLSIAGSLGRVLERCRIPDARTDDDVDRVAHDILAAPGIFLAVGARGLAGALARTLAAGLGGGEPARIGFHLPRPLLVGIGSRDPITRAQVDVLRERLGPMLVEAPGGDPKTHPHADGADVTGFVMSTGEVRATAAEAAERFAHHLAGVVRQHRSRSLVLSGGDIAAAVMAALDIGLLRVAGEILPGLPVCQALGAGHDMTIVTKSGGFGGPDTLLRLLDAGA
jgi:uncharacterized protein YgbK (DUF1537 family)